MAIKELAVRSPDPNAGYEEALELVNKAIDLEADATYYETRGNILVDLRRWDQAIADLSYALNGNLTRTDQKSAHSNLAKCYRAIKLPDMATMHEREVQTLQILGGTATRLGN